MPAKRTATRRRAPDAPPVRLRAVRLPAVDGRSGLPLDGDAPERRRPAEPISETVARILGRRSISLLENLDALMAAWSELIGPELEGRVRLGKCEQHILYIYAASSADIFEIRRFKLRALEARIKQHPAGKTIRQVRLQLDPG